MSEVESTSVGAALMSFIAEATNFAAFLRNPENRVAITCRIEYMKEFSDTMHGFLASAIKLAEAERSEAEAALRQNTPPVRTIPLNPEREFLYVIHGEYSWVHPGDVRIWDHPYGPVNVHYVLEPPDPNDTGKPRKLRVYPSWQAALPYIHECGYPE